MRLPFLIAVDLAHRKPRSRAKSRLNRKPEIVTLVSRLTDEVKQRIHLGMPKHFSLGAAAIIALGSIVLQEAVQAASPPANGAPKAVPVTPASTKRTTSKALYFDLRGYIKAVLAQDPSLIAARLGEMSNQKDAQSLRAKYLPYLHGDSYFGLLQGVDQFNLLGATTVEQKIRVPGTGVETVTEAKPSHVHGLEGFAIAGPTLEMPFFKDGTFLGINTPPAVNAKRAEGEVLAATARLDAQDVAYRATNLFLQAIATSNEAKILRDHLDWLQKQTNLVHEQVKYSLASAADMQLADTKLDESKLDVLLAEQRAVDAFLRTAELLGLDDARLLRIDTKYPQAKPLPSFESTVFRTNFSHPRIEIQQAEAKKADAELALKRADLLPTGQIVSAYRFGTNLGDVGDYRWLSFLSVSAPIFDFGARFDAFKAADLKLEEEKELIAKAHQDVRQEVFDAFTHLHEVLQTQTAITTLVADRQRIVDRLEELTKHETAPIPQLIKAHLDLLEAKRSEEGIKFAVLLASAELEKVTAGAWTWIR